MPLARAIDRARTECRYILSATQIDRLFLLFSRVLGTSERISVADALYAVTIGAAFPLKLDTELGSIECGKRADFAILEDARCRWTRPGSTRCRSGVPSWEGVSFRARRGPG